jgi:hypothetical protein
MTRRQPHGASRRPPMPRPGSGYGRPLRTGPPSSWRVHDLVAQARESDPQQLLIVPADATTSP